MRILRVINTMDPAYGGPCQGIRNSIPELEKLQVHNEVVSLDDPSSHYLNNDSFKIYAIGKGKGPWNYNPHLIQWLSDHISSYDIIIIHGLWLYHSYAVRKAINIFKRKLSAQKISISAPKVYVMPHGMLDPYFQYAAGRKLKAIRNWIYWKLVEGKIVNEVDGLLFTTQSELLLARQPFTPYHPKREINVGYGVPEPPTNRDTMRKAFLNNCKEVENKKYFLFLSRIDKKKGVDLLINAYIAIKKSIHSNTSSSNNLPALVIAGPGIDTEFGQMLQNLINDTPEVKGSIFFSGMLTGDAKWGAFYNCEAFILPSHQENFGIAVVEALSCGKAVIISNQVNIWREIEDAGGGLVANDTLDGVKQLMLTWMALSKQKKEEMGIKARSVYQSEFAIRPNVLRLKKALEPTL